MSEFKIPAGKIIAFDTETTGLFPHKGDAPWCFSFCNEIGETAVCSFPVDPKTRKVDYGSDFNTLVKFFLDPTITKIAHNASFDVRMCEAIGLKIKGPVICTMNLIRLVRSGAPLALKKFCKEYLGIDDDDETELKEATRTARREAKGKGWKIYEGKGNEDGKLAPDYWLAPLSISEKYAVKDAFRCMAVYKTLRPEIEKGGLQKLWDQENQTWKILRKIEKRGIRVFPEKIAATTEGLKKKLKIYQQEAQKITGKALNLRSSLQLRKVFYEQLKESHKYSTKSGLPSTDVDALKTMKHPLAKTILNMRACYKTIEFMDQYRFFSVQHKDGYHYIHPTIHQAMAVTGRESMSNPNLQQVAKGNNDKGIEVLVEARSIFGPRPGYQMRSYDWKNIEVFIPAFASKDPILTKILREGGDMHENTKEYLNTILSNPIKRDPAKTAYFSIQYGIGNEKLSKKLAVDKDTAHLIRHGVHEAYPVLFSWMRDLIYFARENGYVKTPYGRIIYLSADQTYKAPNYYIQGTAADILRQAKIKINWYVRKLEMNAHIVLPIHDEVLVEMKTCFPEKYDKIIVRCMQDNPELKMSINIPVSISAIGESWADKTKIKTI